jgi:hypothetical protein
MGYPSTDWPVAVDSSLARIDNVHTVYADDFNYQDVQIRKIQDWLGISGQFILAV